MRRDGMRRGDAEDSSDQNAFHLVSFRAHKQRDPPRRRVPLRTRGAGPALWTRVLLEIHSSRARAELVDFGAGEMRHRQQQVRRRLFFRDDVAVAFQAAVRAADQHRRRVAAIVQVAVAHAAAPVEQRVVEQVAVAVLGGLQLLEELGELDDLIGADLRVLRQLLGVVAVVRDAVVRLGNADVRVAAVGRLRGRS